MIDLDPFESLQSCGTVEELHAATAVISKRMGFEHFLYAVQVNTSLTRPYQFVLSGYPKQWREHYIEMNYQEIDPTIRHCSTRVTPIAWHNQVFKERDPARMLSEAKDAGLVHGASFSVHGGRGEAAMLSLVTGRAAREAESDVAASMAQGQLLACYLHEAVQRIVLAQGPLKIQKISLTPREKECLLWAAEGKTAWEIGAIINTSERTAVFHLQNAANKMGVKNRHHAISRAVSQGLISP